MLPHSSLDQNSLDELTLAPRPRCFASDERFAALHAQDDEVTQQLKALLQSEAKRHLKSAPVVYPSQGFLMSAMRGVQGRILTCAMMFRLSGEQRYFDQARHDLLQLAALPHWCPAHFLDVGEGALAAGVGLDWLYEELSPSDRDHIEQAIIQNALMPSLDVSIGGYSWMNGDFNWNPVCNAGLTVGALVVWERAPELARRVLERAIDSLPFAGATYAPDGTYPEGPSYWSYGTTFHVLMVEALRSALGTDFDLEKAPGFLHTTDFMAQVKAPSGEEYNFSDYHGGEARRLSEPVMLWFARETGKRHVAQEELKNLQTLSGALKATGQTPRLSRHLAMELLWWNPALLSLKADCALPLQWSASGKLSLAVLRTSWNDSRATYLALKGGTPDGSHAHMDVGSFILETNGVRWALDLGAENYNTMRAANIDLWNYSQESSRWKTFRVGPESHNIIRFNGTAQDVSGHAEIATFPSSQGAGAYCVDLTSLYKSQVENVTRTVWMASDQSVCLKDEWLTKDEPAEVCWQWLTKALVSCEEDKIVLQQDGEALELYIKASVPFGVEIEDFSQPRHLQDSPNPQVSRLAIRLKTASHSSGTLEITAVSRR